MPSYSMLTQKKVVAATMLHNFIREHASGDVDFANFDRDPNYVLTIPERYNKYAASQHASDGSTSESSFVTMDSFRDTFFGYIRHISLELMQSYFQTMDLYRIRLELM